MANTNAAATVWNCPNYVGEIFQIGANQTPFLNMIGGLQGGKVRTVSDFQFALAQPFSLEDASQPAITETASLSAPTPWTYVRAQDVNTCQIFQSQVSVSYAKQSVTGQITADATTGLAEVGVQPVQNEKDFQIATHLKQAATNIEFTFLNGTYAQATAANVAAGNRGIITGCATNTVAAGSVDLSKTLINELLREMAASGAQFVNPVVFVNALQKQRLTDIYGERAPESRNVGGYDVKVVATDFCELGIVWAPRVPAATLLIADLSVCSPVFLSVPGKGVLFYEELSKTGASEKGQLYGQIGLDYGPEEFHGTITGLSTS